MTVSYIIEIGGRLCGEINDCIVSSLFTWTIIFPMLLLRALSLVSFPMMTDCIVLHIPPAGGLLNKTVKIIKLCDVRSNEHIIIVLKAYS